MSHLEGIIQNRGYVGGLSDDLWVGRPSDMRAKEEFKVGCVVKCPGVQMCRLGQVMQLDSDGRLAFVAWMSGLQGWWYLKDLKNIGFNGCKDVKSQRNAMKENYAEMAEL